MKKTETITITDEDRQIVREIIEKVMLESRCEEPEHAKECTRCLHAYDGLCPLRTEEAVNAKAECQVCEKYERAYKPCGTCRHHRNLICRNARSGSCGSYVYDYDGCPCHEANKHGTKMNVR